LDFQRRAI
jgi:type III secretory pathway component EscV